MKKFIGLVLVFLLGVAATLGYLAWRNRAQSREEAVFDTAAAFEVRDELRARADRARQKDGSSQIVLSEADLKALAISTIAEHSYGADYIRAVREIRIELEENSLEVGVSVDVDAIERSGLVEAETVERVLGILPMLRGRNLYVGFRGVPGAADGKITLVEDLEVSLGFLTLPIDDFAEKLGFSNDTIYSNLRFGIGWGTVEEVAARKDEIVLEVLAK